MKAYLQSVWWMMLLQGLLLLVFGVLAVMLPGLTLAGFVLGVAAYLVVAGIINIITTLAGIGRLPLWFLSLILAALEVGVGVYAFKHLDMAALTLVTLLGLVLVVRGILELVTAFGNDYDSRRRSLSAIMAVLAIAAGIAVWVWPGAGALAFAWVAGLYGIVAGSFWIALALEARGAYDAVLV